MTKNHKHVGILGYGQLVIGTETHNVAIETMRCTPDGRRRLTVMVIPSIEQDIYSRALNDFLHGSTEKEAKDD